MSVLISQSSHKSAGIHINVSFNGPYLRSAAERGEGLFICFETESYRLQNALLVPPPPFSSLTLIIVTSPSPLYLNLYILHSQHACTLILPRFKLELLADSVHHFVMSVSIVVLCV